jgi:hypothetical protein
MNLNVSWVTPLGPEFCDVDIQFVWSLGLNLRLGFGPQHDVERSAAEVLLDRELQVGHVTAPEVEPKSHSGYGGACDTRACANERARNNSGSAGAGHE